MHPDRPAMAYYGHCMPADHLADVEAKLQLRDSGGQCQFLAGLGQGCALDRGTPEPTVV